jgi:NAD(P)-dependent dehydrogenase (short-subunit alcohol dehydrogenase family)
MRLKGKTAVITGGSSGIGLATAELFTAEGATVAIIGRDRLKLEDATRRLGAGAQGFVADVSALGSLEDAVRSAARTLGGIDILFANAGTSETPPLAELTESDFDLLIGSNFKGVVFTVRYALPFLREGASVILTGSVAARKGRPGDPLYAASKGAVRSFGRTLAMDEDLLAKRIRVNVITPGATATPLTKAATELPEYHDAVAAMVPMGRWGKPGEIAEGVLFLASDAASYVTGAELTLDGGLAHV